jgi:hypothetical protein
LTYGDFAFASTILVLCGAESTAIAVFRGSGPSAKVEAEAAMDANKRFKSDLVNNKGLENADADKVTGIETSELRKKGNNKPVIPQKKTAKQQ